ncbi:hypothetical protein DPMN_016427 [Dreissena polymorpha]|uniref:Uncharacterized protein n=1 Tax=Dreissena polymorpha TaxID=45954 RepID=A0A9D4N9P0_DREPO|nr:hypothetical protein DPMN_016427 [Dreissena polymorpha]
MRGLIVKLPHSKPMQTVCLVLGTLIPCRTRRAEQAQAAGVPRISGGFQMPILGHETMVCCDFRVKAMATVPMSG